MTKKTRKGRHIPIPIIKLKKPQPVLPCYACGMQEWYWRHTPGGRGDWLCITCHPRPQELRRQAQFDLAAIKERTHRLHGSGYWGSLRLIVKKRRLSEQNLAGMGGGGWYQSLHVTVYYVDKPPAHEF